jgi:hypothetical protein
MVKKVVIAIQLIFVLLMKVKKDQIQFLLLTRISEKDKLKSFRYKKTLLPEGSFFACELASPGYINNETLTCGLNRDEASPLQLR